MTNWSTMDEQVKEWIQMAGERIRNSFSRQIQIDTKANPNDLVTNMDKETEEFFVGKIRNTYPEHKILGEEGSGDQLSSEEGIIWVIDPIDGTMNFVHQQRNFAISIGIFENGENRLGYVYDVDRDELYHAFKGKGAFLNGKRLAPLEEKTLEESIVGINAMWLVENNRVDFRMLTPMVKEIRGTRSTGSCAIELGYLSAGWLDAYISLRLAPWDFAGGMVIVEELGGKATKLNGEPLSLLERSSVIIARPGLHDQLLKRYFKDYVEKK